MHHYLPVALWLYVLGCMGISQLAFRLQGAKRRVAIGCILGLAGTLFYGTYWPLPEWSPRVTGALLPARLAPIKLVNYANYQKLLADLSDSMEPNDTFSVIASSEILSDSLIHALSNSELDKRLVYASQVDRRDRFDIGPLLTRFVLVADPVQIHLSVAEQQVITQPANRILKGVGIGQAYNRLPNEYELAGGVKAYIFEKKRSFTTAEINDLFEAFFASYPEWRPEYHLRMLLLVADITLGDKLRRIDPAAVDELVVRPEETTQTRLGVPNWNSKETFVQSYSALEMNISERVLSACPDANVVYLVGLFKLDVDNNRSAACDEVRVKFLRP